MKKDYTAEVISTGTEILQGFYPDTNAQFLSVELEKLGITTHYHTAVRDDVDSTQRAIEIAIARVDIVIITGGLGPTVDDLNREIVARIYKRELIQDLHAQQLVAERFKKRSLDITRRNICQSLVPERSIPMYNHWGTATGFIIEDDEKATIIALPGPPREMKPMFAQAIAPYLREHFPTDRQSRILTIHTINRSESDINSKIADLFGSEEDVILALLVKEGRVDVRLTGYGSNESEVTARLEAFSKKIIDRVGGEDIYGFDEETLESAVVKLLRAQKMTISVAESCTGGLVSSRLIGIPGASKTIEECFITYSNASKQTVLGVREEALEQFGAVSEETAGEMAQGVRWISGADIGLSITGIAGPTGGTPEKPVGLVYLGLATEGKTLTLKRHFLGTRSEICLFASHHALDFVRRELQFKMKNSK